MRHRYAAAAKRNANTERWLVSYADYMTLMFALFVVLYAMAITNEEDYPELQQRLQQAIALFDFKELSANPSEQATSPILTETGSSILDGGYSIAPAEPHLLEPLVPEKAPDLESELNRLAQQVSEELKGFVDADDVVVNEDEQWLTIELDSRLFFASGSAYLLSSAEQVILRLAEKLKTVNNYIRVRGYTDENSIDSALYPSNWELSAARATRVVRALQAAGVAPQRMAIEAYAQYANQNVAGEPPSDQQNRRVVIAVSKRVWKPFSPPMVNEPQQVDSEKKVVKPDSDTMLTVPLEGGGVRFTTRQDE